MKLKGKIKRPILHFLQILIIYPGISKATTISKCSKKFLNYKSNNYTKLSLCFSAPFSEPFSHTHILPTRNKFLRY
uniref:Putative ovule protein n=1 Tax=Solanum chacoense TaxID=4108 RepID=A0A0V0HMB6_SOLCH